MTISIHVVQFGPPPVTSFVQEQKYDVKCASSGAVRNG
jgi:hypothetical protein